MPKRTVHRWLGMKEMQGHQARANKEDAVANREQKSNREKLKPKKDKSKETPAQASSYAAQYGKPAGKRKVTLCSSMIPRPARSTGRRAT